MRPTLRWLVLLLALLAAACRAPERPIEITLLHYNDVHGHLSPFKVQDKETGKLVEWGGLARLAGLVEQVRAEDRAAGKQTYLLYAGDLLMGTPLSTVFKGEPDMLCFLEMKVDAFVVGNHEFDFGLDNFKRLVEMGGTRLPIISSNIHGPDGKLLVPGSVELELAPGHHLRVIGATTEETPEKTMPANVAGLVFKKPVEGVRAELARIKCRGPTVVLSHCGWNADVEILEQVSEVLLVVGGHDQILLDPPKKVGERLVVQAFEKSKYLGRVDLVYDPATGRTAIVGTKNYRVTMDLPEEPRVAAIVTDWEKRVADKFKERIAEATVFLDGERGRIRYEETNLGNLLADVMRERTGAQAALLNGGAIRGSVNQGPVTMAHVMTAFPYSNDLWTVDLPGKTLLEVLARAVKYKREDEDGGFLHLSGIAIVVEGARLVEARLAGKPIDPAATYTVAITNFMREGGDGYHWLKTPKGVDTGVSLREAIVDAFRRRGKVTAKVEGRIVRRPAAGKQGFRAPDRPRLARLTGVGGARHGG